MWILHNSLLIQSLYPSSFLTRVSPNSAKFRCNWARFCGILVHVNLSLDGLGNTHPHMILIDIDWHCLHSRLANHRVSTIIYRHGRSLITIGSLHLIIYSWISDVLMFIHLLDFRSSDIVNQGSIAHTSMMQYHEVKKNPDYNHVVKNCDAMNLQTQAKLAKIEFHSSNASNATKLGHQRLKTYFSPSSWNSIILHVRCC